MKTQTDRKRKKAGFTLMEVMVGMFILSGVLLGFIGALPHLTLTMVKTEVASNANSVANNKIEFFRTMSFQDIQDNLLSASPIVEDVEINGFNYHVTTTVKTFKIGEIVSDAITVDVKVEWEFSTGQKEYTSTWTIFTRNGLSDKQFIEIS